MPHYHIIMGIDNCTHIHMIGTVWSVEPLWRFGDTWGTVVARYYAHAPITPQEGNMRL